MIAAAAIAVGTVAVLAAWGRARALGDRARCVAHEVRGPLTAALLVVHGAVRRGEVADGPAAQLELELRRAALALGDPHGRADRRDGPPATIDLRALLRCQLATWREVAAACGGRVTLADGDATALPVNADPLRLAQATANIVANALEHGGGEVEIRSGLVGGRVRVEVTDGGPGLAAPRGRRWTRGRGRGLAITARVLARDGGRVRVLPSAHGGRVAIELPVAEARR